MSGYSTKYKSYFRCRELSEIFGRNRNKGCKFEFPQNYEKAKTVTASDPVNKPSHYTSGAVECIDAIHASMSVEAFRGYCKGNVQKYMWRYEEKGGAESLHKAEWYMKRLLATFDADA